MKILHISRTMDQGGAEKIVYQLCEGNNFCQSYVASCGGVYVNSLENIGVKHINIPDIDNKNPILMFKTFWILSIFIIKENVDIIHTHHRMAAFYARLLSFLYRCKHIYTAHNIFYDKRKLMQFALKNAKIVAVGNEVKKNLIDKYSIDESRIITIYNSIYDQYIYEENPIIKKYKSNFRLIGCIGRISKQKGIDVFIRGIDQALKTCPDIKGIIIGDGEDLLKMKSLVQQLNIVDSILFLGYQSNVLSIIRDLDFIVLSSRWEGLPLTPIEVFSQGKTIIASNIPGNKEVVENNKNGILFNKNDANQLSEKIIYLLNNDFEKRQLEKRALETYKNKYSYKEFIDNYIRVYKSFDNN